MTQDELDLDNMLVVRHLNPRGENETLRQAINRLLNWEVQVNLDPLVSSAAQALISQGRAEAKLGWKEAAIAWTIAASVHHQWAKGKDALYTTRQVDYQKHAEDAREKAL